MTKDMAFGKSIVKYILVSLLVSDSFSSHEMH